MAVRAGAGQPAGASNDGRARGQGLGQIEH